MLLVYNYLSVYTFLVFLQRRIKPTTAQHLGVLQDISDIQHRRADHNISEFCLTSLTSSTDEQTPAYAMCQQACSMTSQLRETVHFLCYRYCFNQRDTPAHNCIYIFWSTWKVYTMKYFSIAKLFLIALLRNNYLSPKCIGD